jgi:mxaA protein
MRRLGLIGCVLLLLTAKGALAQIGPVVVEGPRSFGYFLGDVIALDMDIPAPSGYDLRRASLPKTGPVTYWLDLVRLDVVERSGGAVNHWRLHLEYQNFYAALDVRALVIPGFVVNFVSAGERLEANIPSWSFGVSPLREIQPTASDPLDFLRPDIAPQLVARRWLKGAAAAFGAASLALFLCVAFDRGWRPFRRRQARPFAAAARQIRRGLRHGGGDKAYRDWLLVVHRSVDQTAGRRILADDLPGFLADHPAYRHVASEFRQFFAASRRLFFGENSSGAMKDLPPAALVAFCDRLANLERVGG